jgi:hypothetical protein
VDSKDPFIIIHLTVQGKLGFKKYHRELGIGEVCTKVTHIILMAPKKD